MDKTFNIFVVFCFIPFVFIFVSLFFFSLFLSFTFYYMMIRSFHLSRYLAICDLAINILILSDEVFHLAQLLVHSNTNWKSRVDGRSRVPKICIENLPIQISVNHSILTKCLGCSWIHWNWRVFWPSKLHIRNKKNRRNKRVDYKFEWKAINSTFGRF